MPANSDRVDELKALRASDEAVFKAMFRRECGPNARSPMLTDADPKKVADMIRAADGRLAVFDDKIDTSHFPPETSPPLSLLAFRVGHLLSHGQAHDDLRGARVLPQSVPCGRRLESRDQGADAADVEAVRDRRVSGSLSKGSRAGQRLGQCLAGLRGPAPRRAHGVGGRRARHPRCPRCPRRPRRARFEGLRRCLGATSLFLACCQEMGPKVEGFAAHFGIEQLPGLRDHQGNTLLHMAATSPFDRDGRLMRWLLDQGLDPLGCNTEGETPLDCAAAKASLSGLRVLLASGVYSSAHTAGALGRATRPDALALLQSHRAQRTIEGVGPLHGKMVPL